MDELCTYCSTFKFKNEAPGMCYAKCMEKLNCQNYILHLNHYHRLVSGVNKTIFYEDVISLTSNSGHPLNLSTRQVKMIKLPKLERHHFEEIPSKMKLYNHGFCVILSGKWNGKRPYISKGPLLGKYVFCSMHFHWGVDNIHGSLHSIDGVRFPLEIHIIYIKAKYKNDHLCLNNEDGFIVEVHLCDIDSKQNENLQSVTERLHKIQNVSLTTKILPQPLSCLIKPFWNNYFIYSNKLMIGCNMYNVQWIVSTEIKSVAHNQINNFRLLDNKASNNQNSLKIISPVFYQGNESKLKTTIFHNNKPKVISDNCHSESSERKSKHKGNGEHEFNVKQEKEEFWLKNNKWEKTSNLTKSKYSWVNKSNKISKSVYKSIQQSKNRLFKSILPITIAKEGQLLKPVNSNKKLSKRNLNKRKNEICLQSENSNTEKSFSTDCLKITNSDSDKKPKYMHKICNICNYITTKRLKDLDDISIEVVLEKGKREIILNKE